MKRIRTLVRVEFILIYLVIIAGSVVRMTGSGMGCPDWPKCFGYLVPPTERSQLEWQSGRSFEKGQIIIVEESLRVAKSDFTAGSHYNPGNWEPYTRHDYAVFNPFHTWTEYINRLVGALSGIPMFLLFAGSLFYIRKDYRLALLSAAGLFMLGFEAWLGKLVVDGNLIPGSITIHMIGALVIIAILCVLAGITSSGSGTLKYTSLFRNLLLISLLFTLIQIVLGTQVRESIDIMNKEGLPRGEWIENLSQTFYIHRSFSIVIVLLNVFLWKVNRDRRLGFKEMEPIMILIILEIIFGILLSYLGVPAFAQPVHLLLSTLLFGFQFYAIVRYYISPKTRIIPVS